MPRETENMRKMKSVEKCVVHNVGYSLFTTDVHFR